MPNLAALLSAVAVIPDLTALLSDIEPFGVEEKAPVSRRPLRMPR